MISEQQCIIKVYNKIGNRNYKSPNEIIEYEDYAEIILCDKFCNEKSRAIIDKEDIPIIIKHKWYDSKGYAMTTLSDGSKLPLHRFLMQVTDPLIICDHKNRNPMDDRKCNLRLTDKKGNGKNRSITGRNTSGVAGVSWHKTRRQWRARLKMDDKEIHLGWFKNFEDAVKARLEGEIKYYGEFALQAHDYIN